MPDKELFSPIKKALSELQSVSIVNGQFLISTDTRQCFVDAGNQRLPVQDVIMVDNYASLPLAPLVNKLYLTKDTDTLYHPSIAQGAVSWNTISISEATTTKKGSAQLATDNEISTGTDTNPRITTPKQLADNYTRHTAIALRENSTLYTAGARAVYPGKAGYVLMCSASGTSAASLPAWPESVVSGATQITDGSVEWTVYDGTKVYSFTTPLSENNGTVSIDLSAYATASALTAHTTATTAHSALFIAKQNVIDNEHKLPYAYLSDTPELATVATSGSYTDLADKPSIPDAQIQSDWAQTNSASVDYIKNKPTFATVAATGKYSDLDGIPSLAAVATSGSYTDLDNKPTIPAAQIQADWSQATASSLDYIKNKPSLSAVATSGLYSDLDGKPTLATVATSGSYTDLDNKPTIPDAQIQADWNQTNSALLDYIKNKPTIPDAQVQADWAQADNTKVDYIKNKPGNASASADGFMSKDDKSKLDALNENEKGYFDDPAALRTAHPAGQQGWFATVGSTDSIWVWSTSATDWIDTGAHSINPTWGSIQGKPTTIAGYAITDCYISGTTIHIGGVEVTAEGTSYSFTAPLQENTTTHVVSIDNAKTDVAGVALLAPSTIDWSSTTAYIFTPAQLKNKFAFGLGDTLTVDSSRVVNVKDATVSQKGVTKRGGDTFTSETTTKEYIQINGGATKYYSNSDGTVWTDKDGNVGVEIKDGYVYVIPSLLCFAYTASWKTYSGSFYRICIVTPSGTGYHAKDAACQTDFTQGQYVAGYFTFTWTSGVLTVITNDDISYTYYNTTHTGSTVGYYQRNVAVGTVTITSGTESKQNYSSEIAASEKGVAAYAMKAAENTGTAGQALLRTSTGWSWQTISTSIPVATISALGGAYLATDTEISAGTSTVARIITPKQLSTYYMKAASNTGSTGQYLQRTSSGWQWASISVTVPEATTSTIGGGYLATANELKSGTLTTARVITPKLLSDEYAHKTDIPVRQNGTAYGAGSRVVYPGKYGYLLTCIQAGTSATSLPSWPSGVESGVTQITDGGVTWRIYDTIANGSMPIGTVFAYPLSHAPLGAFLLNGQTIASCDTAFPEFWSWIQAAVTAGTIRTLTNEQYEAEITATTVGSNPGQCGAFVISGTSVRLPTINGFVQGSSTTSDRGTTMAAGLPNITGSLTSADDYELGLTDTFTQEGALRAYNRDNMIVALLYQYRGTSWYKTTFDASLSNSIYGASTTVQPPAVKYSYCIQVFNAASDISTEEVAQLNATIQLKADKNLGNIDSNLDVIMAYHIESDGSWVRIWKSGWVEQGGLIASVVQNSYTSYTLTFPVEFSNTRYTMLLTQDDNNQTLGLADATNGNAVHVKTTSTAVIATCSWTYGRNWYACGQGNPTSINDYIASL